MSSKLVSVNPFDQSVNGEVGISTSEEIKSAVVRSREAQEKWKKIKISEKISLLRSVYNGFQENEAEIVELITKEVGTTITQSKGEFDFGMNYFDWYLNNSESLLEPVVTYKDENQVDSIVLEPLGVSAVITPWNFPFGIVIWGVIPNLLAGNSVVFKHSEECPLLGKLIEKIILESNLPEDVFIEIYGDGAVGDLLVNQDVDLIWFTGSSAVGKKLYKLAADKFIRIVLELGGSAPGIVLKDAKLDEIAEYIYNRRFYKSGQICEGLKRLIVHKDVCDDLIGQLKDVIAVQQIGNPLQEETTLGPLVSKKQLNLLESQFTDAVEKGAKVIIGGKPLEQFDGAYFEPTLLSNISYDMRVWKEEVFGPVLPIVTFETEEEAIQLANDTSYGLGAHIFTEDLSKANKIASQIDTGMLGINLAYYGRPENPFGGSKQSGLGREHGPQPFHDVCNTKLIASPL